MNFFTCFLYFDIWLCFRIVTEKDQYHDSRWIFWQASRGKKEVWWWNPKWLLGLLMRALCSHSMDHFYRWTFFSSSVSFSHNKKGKTKLFCIVGVLKNLHYNYLTEGRLLGIIGVDFSLKCNCGLLLDHALALFFPVNLNNASTSLKVIRFLMCHVTPLDIW